MIKSLYRSEVQVEPKLTAVLTKIKNWTTAKKSRFVVKKGGMKYEGKSLVSFSITPASATGTVVLDAGPAFGITAASVIIQGLTYTAKLLNGFYPNDVQIQYIDPAAAHALTVAVVDRKILVTLAHSGVAITSTADDVKAAIIANAAANALVSIAGTGAVALIAQVLTALAGGSSLQTYDKADIVSITRLRSRRWSINIAPGANPAA